MTTKEFKGKDNLKLDIVVSADELYVIRTGVETNFAKSFLLAASLIQNLDTDLPTQLNTGRSLNPHLVEAMMGFPQCWTDVCLPTQDLQTGCVLPQSPVSLGSVVEKLQHLRNKSLQNITNSIHNTLRSEDNTNSS